MNPRNIIAYASGNKRFDGGLGSLEDRQGKLIDDGKGMANVFDDFSSDIFNDYFDCRAFKHK